MAVQSAHKFTAGGGPHFDGAIPAGGHNILLIEVDHIDGGSVANEYSAECYLAGRGHVPHGNGAILGASHHHAVVEAQVQHRLAVMDEGVDHFATIHVPDTNCGVAGTTNDHLVIVLQAQHRSSVSNQSLQWKEMLAEIFFPSLMSRAYLNALQIRAIPDLDGVVPETGNNLTIIVLQTVDTLGVLRSAINPSQHVPTSSPVVLYTVDVLKSRK